MRWENESYDKNHILDFYSVSPCILLMVAVTFTQVVSFLLHNMSLHVAWCLHAIINSDTVSEESLSSLLSKRTTLFEQLEHFLYAHTEVQEEGKRANQPACRVSILH